MFDPMEVSNSVRESSTWSFMVLAHLIGEQRSETLSAIYEIATLAPYRSTDSSLLTFSLLIQKLHKCKSILKQRLGFQIQLHVCI